MISLSRAGGGGTVADGSITKAKLAADCVDASKIEANAVGSSELADNAVDAAAIADGAVTGPKLNATLTLANDVNLVRGIVTRSLNPELGAGAAHAAAILWKERINQFTTTDGTAGVVADAITVPDNTIGIFDLHVTGYNETTATEEAGYFIRHVVSRRGGGAAALVSTVNLLADEDDTTWAASTAVSGNDVRATVTGETGQTIRWTIFWTYKFVTDA